MATVTSDPKGSSEQEGATSPHPAPPEPPPSAEKGPVLPDDPALSLSEAVDALPSVQLFPGASIAPAPGDVPPAPAQPSIPPELAGRLNPRELRTVWHMVAGLSYQQALDACGVAKRATLRDEAPPHYLILSVQAVLRQIAYEAGLSRRWIVENTVALYRRAAQAEEVLDRKGRPTGTYRFDGATAANCLKMLAEWEGSLYPKTGRGGIPPGDVVSLMLAVAERGRPGVELRRARLVGSSTAADGSPSAALQQRSKPE